MRVRVYSHVKEARVEGKGMHKWGPELYVEVLGGRKVTCKWIASAGKWVAAAGMAVLFPVAIAGLGAGIANRMNNAKKVKRIDDLQGAPGCAEIDITMEECQDVRVTARNWNGEECRDDEYARDVTVECRWGTGIGKTYEIEMEYCPSYCDMDFDFTWKCRISETYYLNGARTDKRSYMAAEEAKGRETLGKQLEQEANHLMGEEKQAKLHQAKKEYEKAFRLNPNENIYQAHVCHVQAKIHIEQKDYDAAISEAQKAIDLDSTEQTTYQETMRTADKLKSIEKAASLASDGERLFRQGQFTAAAKKFTAAHNAAPDVQKAHYDTRRRAALTEEDRIMETRSVEQRRELDIKQAAELLDAAEQLVQEANSAGKWGKLGKLTKALEKIDGSLALNNLPDVARRKDWVKSQIALVTADQCMDKANCVTAKAEKIEILTDAIAKYDESIELNHLEGARQRREAAASEKTRLEGDIKQAADLLNAAKKLIQEQNSAGKLGERLEKLTKALEKIEESLVLNNLPDVARRKDWVKSQIALVTAEQKRSAAASLASDGERLDRQGQFTAAAEKFIAAHNAAPDVQKAHYDTRRGAALTEERRIMAAQEANTIERSAREIARYRPNFTLLIKAGAIGAVLISSFYILAAVARFILAVMNAAPSMMRQWGLSFVYSIFPAENATVATYGFSFSVVVITSILLLGGLILKDQYNISNAKRHIQAGKEEEKKEKTIARDNYILAFDYVKRIVFPCGPQFNDLINRLQDGFKYLDLQDKYDAVAKYAADERAGFFGMLITAFNRIRLQDRSNAAAKSAGNVTSNSVAGFFGNQQKKQPNSAVTINNQIQR